MTQGMIIYAIACAILGITFISLGGFQEVPMEKNVIYSRGNIKMEIIL